MNLHKGSYIKKMKQMKEFEEKLNSLISFMNEYPEDYWKLQTELNFVKFQNGQNIEALQSMIEVCV